MSDEARQYVKAHSPYTGQTFWLHYALADIANAQHDYELWIGERRLMEEWPFSRAAIARGFAELVADGFLTIVVRPAPGRKARYRFEFAEVPEVRNVSRSAKRSVNVSRSEANVSRIAKRSPITRTEVNQNTGTPKRARERDAIFETLLSICDLDADRLTASARGEVNRAVKELRETGATEESLRSASTAYRIRYETAVLTPSALAKHYPALGIRTKASSASERRTERCQSCDGTGWLEEPADELGPGTVTRCSSCSGAGTV